jgi:integral membrane sensor domain MASE1
VKNQLPFILFSMALGAVVGAILGMVMLQLLPGATSWPFLLGAIGSYIGMIAAQQVLLRRAAKERSRKR